MRSDVCQSVNDEYLTFTSTASPIMQSNDAIQSQSGGKKTVLVLYCHVLEGSGVKHVDQAKTGPQHRLNVMS
jgi:hypothetical protein